MIYYFTGKGEDESTASLNALSVCRETCDEIMIILHHDQLAIIRNPFGGEIILKEGDMIVFADPENILSPFSSFLKSCLFFKKHKIHVLAPSIGYDSRDYDDKVIDLMEKMLRYYTMIEHKKDRSHKKNPKYVCVETKYLTPDNRKAPEGYVWKIINGCWHLVVDRQHYEYCKKIIKISLTNGAKACWAWMLANNVTDKNGKLVKPTSTRYIKMRQAVSNVEQPPARPQTEFEWKFGYKPYQYKEN